MRGGLVTDAVIVALLREHGVDIFVPYETQPDGIKFGDSPRTGNPAG